MKRRKSGKKSKKDKTDGGATTGDEKTDEEKETNDGEPVTAESGDETADATAQVPTTESTDKTATSDGDDKDETEGIFRSKLMSYSVAVEMSLAYVCDSRRTDRSFILSTTHRL